MIKNEESLMSDCKILHLVAFNVPYPADYGGVIDVYYKLKALSDESVGIILHTFSYGRERSSELEKLCKEVHYYTRKSGLKYFIGSLPYIVATRCSSELTNNLLNDSHPVLFEGLHSTCALMACKEAGKQTLVRTHNIEHRYYKMLAKSDRNRGRKIYLNSEARKLKKYERILFEADHLLSISTTDASYFKEIYGESHFISAFHHYTQVEIKKGKGEYILFHGNLSVPENESAILYLIDKVLSKITFPVIIAGKNPGKVLTRVCNKYSHIELLPNVSDERMNQLICEAHINLLYTYQPTGLKLKLLHSLYAGRFCLTNLLMLSGSGLDDLCHIYNNPEHALSLINQLMLEEFPAESVEKRAKELAEFNNQTNAEKIISLLETRSSS
jgi:hypothetical protein